MSEKERFVVSTNEIGEIIVTDVETGTVYHYGSMSNFLGLIRLLNEQQELIEELQVSDEMGWKRAELFEKKCPKELHNKKMYIKRLEYKVQKFKEENEQLKQKIQRWKNLYELKDAEVTARVDGLNKVCEYYTSEVLFKSDVDPNKAVKEVINEILNTEVEL